MRVLALLAACTMVGWTMVGCEPKPALQMRAPALIERALTVASDLRASAVLVPASGEPQAPRDLDADDDGVTFTGFIEAPPGQYTLEITFSGVPDGGDRHFLGRLTSDTFTVVQGETTTPLFTKPVDVIGRDGDGGDDDGDGLGFLLELLAGTDPNAPDSDDDTILDGADCRPNDAAVAFEIVEGGRIDDCDADGHDDVNALLGDPGDDCDDNDATIHPGVDDDCGDPIDSDCNNQTCPIADFDGPTLNVIAPAEGATLGCHSVMIAEATDPSDVASVFAQFPDSPITGGFPRTVLFIEGANDQWTSTALNSSGPGLTTGPESILIRASDSDGNSTDVVRNVELAIEFPTVTWDAPQVLSDSPIIVTLSPAGVRPLVALEVRAAPLDASGAIQMESIVTLGAVDVGGGTVSVDPADLPSENSAVFPFARDDAGNELVPFDGTLPSQGSLFADFRCDDQTHNVPVMVKRGGRGLASLLDHLQEAITLARDIDPDAELVSIFGLGLDANGQVNLDDPGFSKQWQYTFKAPTQPRNGMTLQWAPAGFSTPNPNVIDVAVDPDEPVLVNVNTIRDSDDMVQTYDARPSCSSPGFTGSESDQLVITNVDGENRVLLLPNNQDSLILNANSLQVIFDCP